MALIGRRGDQPGGLNRGALEKARGEAEDKLG